MSPQSAAIAGSGNPLKLAMNPKSKQKYFQNPPIRLPVNPPLPSMQSASLTLIQSLNECKSDGMSHVHIRIKYNILWRLLFALKVCLKILGKLLLPQKADTIKQRLRDNIVQITVFGRHKPRDGTFVYRNERRPVFCFSETHSLQGILLQERI